MILVAIIEDHLGQRESIAALIDAQQDMQCIGAYASLTTALRGFDKHADPNVVLVDYHLRRETGVQCLQALRHEFPSATTKYLMLTIERQPDRVKEAFSAGADGYLAKEESTSREIVASVRQLHLGSRSPISDEVSKALILSLRREPNHERLLATLTRRERETLEHLAGGRSLKEIAELMKISFNSVAGHTKSIYRKLNVQSAREAVRFLR